MEKPLVLDREQIPSLDEKELIQLDETRLTKYGATVISVLGAIGAFVLAFVGLSDDAIADQDPGVVLLGAAILLSVAVLAWAMVAAADIQARGRATAANLSLRARPSVTVAPAGVAGSSPGLWCHLKNREKDCQHLVIDSRDNNGSCEYLLARGDELPNWYRHDQIDSWEVKVG